LRERPELRQRTIRVLRSLCGSWGVLPASYTLQGEVKVTGGFPFACGGYGEIWNGTWGSEKVAVKFLKITSAANPEKVKKVWCQPLIISNARLTPSSNYPKKPSSGSG
jgi:hypothetical protein